MLNLAPKDLEKVIYFAAYMITEVDEKGRHEDLAELRAELEVQKKQMETTATPRSTTSRSSSSPDMAALEKDGASQAERERARKQGEREMAKIRRRFDGDIDASRPLWERFKDLKVGDLEGDEPPLPRHGWPATAPTSRVTWARPPSRSAWRPSTWRARSPRCVRPSPPTPARARPAPSSA